MAGRGVYAIGAAADKQARAKKSEAERAATVKVLRVDFTSRKGGSQLGLGPRDNGQEWNGLPDLGSGPKDR